MQLAFEWFRVIRNRQAAVMLAATEWCSGLVLPKPRHGNALSPEKAKRLLQLEKEGLPRVVIAERLGLHKNTITNYLRLAGRPLMMVGMRAKLAA